MSLEWSRIVVVVIENPQAESTQANGSAHDTGAKRVSVVLPIDQY